MSKVRADRLFLNDCEISLFHASVGTPVIHNQWAVMIYPRKWVTVRSNFRFIWIVWKGDDIVDGGILRTRIVEKACQLAVMKLFQVRGHKK